MQELMRESILRFYLYTGRLDRLFFRALHLEIGYYGHITEVDGEIVEKYSLAPLNRFERWLLASLIEQERQHRRSCMREAVFEVTGEEFENW